MQDEIGLAKVGLAVGERGVVVGNLAQPDGACLRQRFGFVNQGRSVDVEGCVHRVTADAAAAAALDWRQEPVGLELR